MTIESWIKSHATGQMMAKGAFANGNVNYVVSHSNNGSAAVVGFSFNHDGDRYFWRAQFEVDISSMDQWNHLAVVLDNEAEECRIYYNGIRAASLTDEPETWPSGIILPSNTALRVNAGIDETLLDELRISDIPRYTDNFTPSFHFEPDGHTRGLWHFNEGTGTTAHDSSQFENHGVFYGTGAEWSRDVPAQ